MNIRNLFFTVFCTTTVFAQSQIAAWINPRGAVIGDSAYIEGGYLQKGKFVDGKWQDVTFTTPASGLMFNFSLCSPLTTTNDNIDDRLATINENVPQDSAVYVGGGMFANDHEFYTFGGLASDEPRQGDNTILRGDIEQAAPSAEAPSGVVSQWDQGAGDTSLDNITTHIAMGAWTSALTENRGWWFGGMQGQNGSAPLKWVYDEQGTLPSITSPTLLQIDMRDPGDATFQNLTLPAEIIPRAEGALVWLPYGSNGILVAFGGTMEPGDLTTAGLYSDATNNNISMTEIYIYDIGTNTWAIQETLEGTPRPPPTASFCTVTTSADDGSGHFVYAYGGYGGTGDPQSVAFDQVWVLAIPAFQWILVNEGVESHRRQNHLCIKANPATMLTIGGTTEFGQSLGNPDYLDVFDMNTLTWSHTYDGSATTPYKVNATITDQIGGSVDGGFGDLPSDLNTTVRDILQTSYPTKLPTPTERMCAPTATTTSAGGGGKGDNHWQIPVAASLASVAGVAIIATLIWCLCRGKRRSRSTEATGSNAMLNILSWRRGVNDRSTAKSTVSDETQVAPVVDYFDPKLAQERERPAELVGSGTTSPAPPYGHRSPRLIAPTSPLSDTGASLISRSSRHVHSRHESYEMDNNVSQNRDSTSFRNHPLYPGSFAGDDYNSNQSDALSDRPSRQYYPQQTTLYELPNHTGSRNENLAQLPADGTAIVAAAGPSGVARKPLLGRQELNSAQQPTSSDRPTHHRHDASVDSNLPALPSPGPVEDQRMSRHIDSLPADPQGRSNLQHSDSRATNYSNGAYYENPDDNATMATWSSAGGRF